MTMQRMTGAIAAAAMLTLGAHNAHAGVDVRMNPTDAAGTVQNEVSLSLNLNPGGLVSGGNVNLLAAYNDDPGNIAGPGLGISYSTDSGATWTETAIGTGVVFNATTLFNVFDPISASDTSGTLYAGYVATTNNSGDANGIYVQNSTDGGATWNPEVAVINNGAAAGMNALADPTFRFNDKPHLAVDTTGGGFANNLYVAFIQDVGGTPDKSDIRFARSIDGGASWSVVGSVLNTNAGADFGNGPNIAVTPTGDVYVAWIDVDVTQSAAQTATLQFNTSTDGGVTFNPTATTVNIGSFTSLPGNLSTTSGHGTGDDARARGFPVIEADPTDNTGQTLYLTYAAQGTAINDEADIFFTRSTDGGANWSTPLVVNDDATNHDQYNPWMAVKADGTIDIAWYDKRNGPDDDLWDVYIANSTDGGLSFSVNTRITDVSFASTVSSAKGDWLGEYLGLVTDASDAYLGFVRRGDAEGDVYFDSIPNAQIGTVIPEPASAAMLGLTVVGVLARRRR